MDYDLITLAFDGPAAVITFDRPQKRNAISTAVMTEMIAAAHAAAARDGISGLIVTGGEDFFSAGADLNDAQAIDGPAQGLAYFNRWHELCSVFENLSIPTIAAIEGFCLTGGFEFAMACDLRVAAKDATFALTSSKIGTVPGAGGTQRLPRLVGTGRALEILFGGDPVDAPEAHRIGLLNRLTEPGGALKEAKAMVDVYAARAPVSLALAKRAVHRGMQMDLASGLEFEAFLVSTIYGTEDRKEGIAAFLEKRKAVFRGK